MKETKLGAKYANDLPKVFSDGLFGLVIKKTDLEEKSSRNWREALS